MSNLTLIQQKINFEGIYTTKKDIQALSTSKKGLNNLGKTCYMNCSIQILIHIKLFIEELVKYINPLIKNLTYIIIELSNTFINIENNSKENYISQSYSPINFKNTFINLHSQYSKGQHNAKDL